MRVRPFHRPATAVRPSRRPAALVAAASVLAAGLAGCGNKGDLYLSDPSTGAPGTDALERELDGAGDADGRDDAGRNVDGADDDGNGGSGDVPRRRGTPP